MPSLRALFYVGCITLSAFQLRPRHTIDPELSPIMNELVQDIEIGCPKWPLPVVVEVRFGKLDNQIIGVCQKNWYHSWITVNKKYWDRFSYDDQYQLLAHEGSHCLLDEPHRDDKSHYMYPYFVTLTKAQVEQQYLALIKNKCDNVKK